MLLPSGANKKLRGCIRILGFLLGAFVSLSNLFTSSAVQMAQGFFHPFWLRASVVVVCSTLHSQNLGGLAVRPFWHQHVVMLESQTA